MAGLELRPRRASEIVDAAAQLYKLYFVPLVTITAIVYAPFVVLNLLLTGGDRTLMLTRPATAITLVAVGWIFTSIAEASVVLAVSDSYLQGGIDVGSVMGRTMKRVISIMVSVLLKGFIVGFGLALGFLVGGIVGAILGVGVVGAAGGPNSTAAVAFAVGIMMISLLIGGVLALYYYACYFAVPATVVVENLSASKGLSRSRALSKGVKRKVLASLGTSMTVLFVIQFVLALIAQSIPGPAAIGFVVEQAATIVIAPIIGVIAALLYYDARIINEGFDIEIMAAELGGIEPPPAPAG